MKKYLGLGITAMMLPSDCGSIRLEYKPSKYSKMTIFISPNQINKLAKFVTKMKTKQKKDKQDE